MYLLIPILTVIYGGVAPTPTYDAFFAFSGRYTKKQIVVSSCEPGYGYDRQQHLDWCEQAEAMIVVPKWRGHYRRKFCVRTGNRTLERCQDVLDQNMRSYKRKGKVMYLGYKRMPQPVIPSPRVFTNALWHDNFIDP